MVYNLNGTVIQFIDIGCCYTVMLPEESFSCDNWANLLNALIRHTGCSMKEAYDAASSFYEPPEPEPLN